MERDVNGITLHYTKAGTGRPLLLLHGNGEDSRIFDALMGKLHHHFTVYAVDSRNHGGSSRTSDFTYEAMAEDCCQFMAALGLCDVGVVGFSDGAIVALPMALRTDAPLRKIALLGVNLKPGDFKKSIYDSLVKEYAATNDPLVKMMLEQPNIELADLRGVNVPALVVVGEHDLYRKKMVTGIMRALPDAVLLTMAGHDHGSYIVHQDILYPELYAFFS